MLSCFLGQCAGGEQRGKVANADGGRFKAWIKGSFREKANIGADGKVTGARSSVKLEDEYQVDGLIGRGQFGIISTCTLKSTGKKFAVKSLTKESLNSEDAMGDIRNEVKILELLKGHANVVAIESVFEDDAAIHIVMELCTGGSLTDHIAKQGEYSERRAAETIRTILQVIQHCHSKGIVHGDLKLANFLLSDDSDTPVVKAIDFGVSQFCKPGEVLQKMVGSPLFIAPEVLDEAYGPECDVWSIGVILYTLLCGQPPFEGDSVLRIFDAVRSAQVNFESEPWPLVSEEAKDIIRRMLEKDPRKRATVQELLDSAWINGSASSDVSLASVMLPRMKKFSAMSKLRHLALLATAEHMSEEHAEEMKRVFDSVDADKNGTLTFSEMRDALQDMGAHLSEQEMQKSFKFADIDGSGSIEYKEFVAATMVMKKQEHADAIRRAFEHMDKDGSGCLTFEEFAEVCAGIKHGDHDATVKMVEEAMIDYGYSKDENIDYW